ncbi:hypothetical protein [Nocardia sp. NPDC050406]|uniref:hypothetical protein n=1 Tax=Nocardia sp. NPDC050406 TaxID=3364318 RepID=UPI0037AE3D2E
MTEVSAANSDAQRLLTEILTRYGSLDEFLAQVQRELDAPTEELPRVGVSWSDPSAWPIRPIPSDGEGRHARKE